MADWSHQVEPLRTGGSAKYANEENESFLNIPRWASCAGALGIAGLIRSVAPS
jgi:hypothetical protein